MTHSIDLNYWNDTMDIFIFGYKNGFSDGFNLAMLSFLIVFIILFVVFVLIFIFRKGKKDG